jgi:hypothetical protein
MLNSDVYWITCEMVVICDLLCWITTILAGVLVGLKSLMISLDYQSYMGSSARIWSLRWLFLYLCSYNLDGFVTAWLSPACPSSRPLAKALPCGWTQIASRGSSLGKVLASAAASSLENPIGKNQCPTCKDLDLWPKHSPVAEPK